MPQHIHTLSVNFNINEMVRYNWWTAQNIGYALKKCGWDPLLVSSVWTDFQQPEQCKWIDFSHVATSKTSLTAQATIITDENNNQITAFYPWASGEWLEPSLENLLDEVSYAIVSPNNPQTMLRHTRDLWSSNILFFFDPGQPLSAFTTTQLHEVMKLAPYLVVNEYEKDLFCKIAQIWFDDLIMSFEKVIVTLWEQGVEVRSWPDLMKFNAYSVEKVIDPTWAWDAFRWGLLGWLSSGMSWIDAIDQWQKLASLCVQTKGTIERDI